MPIRIGGLTEKPVMSLLSSMNEWVGDIHLVTGDQQSIKSQKILA
jgi:hypothetical protein